MQEDGKGLTMMKKPKHSGKYRDGKEAFSVSSVAYLTFVSRSNPTNKAK